MKLFKQIQKKISYLLVLSLVIVSLLGCGDAVSDFEDNGNIPLYSNTLQNVEDSSINIGFFVYEKLFEEYSQVYDTFNATVKLSDGTIVYGIGYSDFSCYFETIEGDKGFFPAGFLISEGDLFISEEEINNGLEITNLDFDSDDFGFVLAYDTESYYEHCVVDGKYVKYGIDDNGVISHTETVFSKEVCDTSLGPLYSYDENKYLYDPDVGNFINLTGQSLAETLDYDAIEQEINKILDEQDEAFATVDLETTVDFAQKAVVSYLLSMQEETFLGCDVKELVKEAESLDPMECFRITPSGNIIIDVRYSPQGNEQVAKWIVGMGCGIAVAGSIAVQAFVPAATPVTGAICGAAIEVFMQVVVENNATSEIEWDKVAVASLSGAIMAWICPMGAATFAKNVSASTGNALLGELAGYGVLTLSNSITAGATNAALAMLDGRSNEEVMDSFYVGATVGACCTILFSISGKIGSHAFKVINETHPDNWLLKLSEKTTTYIGKHQVHIFKDSIEDILSPKTIYQASQSGIKEYNRQIAMATGKKGGAYKEVKIYSNGEFTEVHEIPSFESTGAIKRAEGPSIKMSKEDHRLTASWGNSKEAQLYRKQQSEYMMQGKYREAIQMDIDNIHEQFGNKYDDAIEEMIKYAVSIGWW